jgi:hypothetical protein
LKSSNTIGSTRRETPKKGCLISPQGGLSLKLSGAETGVDRAILEEEARMEKGYAQLMIMDKTEHPIAGEGPEDLLHI